MTARLTRRPGGPARLRALLESGQTIVAPGAFDPLAARLVGLVSPVTVLEGVRQWLGGTSVSPVPRPGGVGVLYGVMFLVLLGASLGGLAARYRKAGLS